MTNSEVRLPMQNDLTVSHVAGIAMQVFPYFRRPFLDKLKASYIDELQIARCYQQASEDFIAVCNWVLDVKFTKSIHDLSDFGLIAEIERLVRDFERTPSGQLKALSYDKKERPVYDFIERQATKIVRQLMSLANIDGASNSLITALGNGHEANNQEALKSWVKNSILLGDLPGDIDAASALLPELEKTLNKWSTDRFV
jgi:hypothetical protein